MQKWRGLQSHLSLFFKWKLKIGTDGKMNEQNEKQLDI